MAINRPSTKTIISTATWGVPITDEVNLLRTDVNALKAVPSWTAMSLVNGWAAAAVRMDPQYRKTGDIVYLRGVVSGGTPGSTISTLPSGYRPVQDILQVSAAFVNGTTWSLAILQLLATGVLSYHPNSPANPTYVPIQMAFSMTA